MNLRPNQLAAHLERTLAPVYTIHGDEPLLAMEAGDDIRAAARKAGCDEREVLVAEKGFDWDAFRATDANLGLFGSRKLIDLRIPSGKPGIDGAKALEASAASVANNPNPDNVLLVTLPKLDRATQSSAWFTALADAGVAIAVFALERDELPAWIAARLARQRQRANAETIAFLADRCEGNLFAAKQEIAKLGLLLPEGEIPHDAVERAVTDVARYDVLQLSEAWLVGDPARALKIIESLETEGEGLPLLLWQLGEDLHALAAIREAAYGRCAAQRARVGQAPGRDGTRGKARFDGCAHADAARARAARRFVERDRRRQCLGRPARSRADPCRPPGGAARHPLTRDPHGGQCFFFFR
jgi:DNA polymerase-3 subunit delta